MNIHLTTVSFNKIGFFHVYDVEVAEAVSGTSGGFLRFPIRNSIRLELAYTIANEISARFKSSAIKKITIAITTVILYERGSRRLISLKVRYLILLTIKNERTSIITNAMIAGISPLSLSGKQ